MKKYTTEQIITKLRQAEILIAEGKSTAEAIRQLGVTDVTFYRWRKEYGGMTTNEAKRIKELEAENMRLKKVVANLVLDNEILKEVNSKNF